MKSLIFVAALLFSTFANAMPQATFNCESADGRYKIEGTVGTYTEVLHEDLVLTIDGQEALTTLGRQWLDDQVGNFEMNFADHEDAFARKFIVKMTANGWDFSGQMWIETWDDYAGPIHKSELQDITCSINP